MAEKADMKKTEDTPRRSPDENSFKGLSPGALASPQRPIYSAHPAWQRPPVRANG